MAAEEPIVRLGYAAPGPRSSRAWFFLLVSALAALGMLWVGIVVFTGRAAIKAATQPTTTVGTSGGSGVGR